MEEYNLSPNVDRDYIEVNLDLHDKTSTSDVQEYYILKQGDHISRVLRCNLTKGGLIPIDLKNSILTLYIKKADMGLVAIKGTVVDATNGIVDFPLTRQSLAIADKIICEVVKIGSDASTMSFPLFTLQVEDSIADDDLIESTDEFSLLNDALASVSDCENRLNTQYNEFDVKFDNKYSEIETQFSDKYTEISGQFEAKYNGLEEEYATELTNVKNKTEEIVVNHLTVSVKDFGAKGDGVTDDTEAIQTCLNHCVENGYTCYFPSGKYMVTHGFKLANSWEDENANKLISIEGESYHNTIIDLFPNTEVDNWNVFDFAFNKKVICKNISSNLGFNTIPPEVYWQGEVEWRKALREKDFYLENCIVHGSNVQQGYYHYINSPAPDSYERYSEATYTRYPLEITNGSGYNAININNFATNEDGSIGTPEDNSAIGIVDAVNNSTGVIFIDMMGEGRSFERYISRTAEISSTVRPQTVWEVHRNGHIAIGCSVDEQEYGWNTIKMRDKSPSIRFIDANNNNTTFDLGVVHQEWGDELFFKRGNIGAKLWIDNNNLVHLVGISGGVDGGLTVNQESTANYDTSLKISRDNVVCGIGIDADGNLRKYYSDKQANQYADGKRGNQILINRSGASGERPSLNNDWIDIGVMYFDTTLNKPIWWNGTSWVDSSGSNV